MIKVTLGKGIIQGSHQDENPQPSNPVSTLAKTLILNKEIQSTPEEILKKKIKELKNDLMARAKSHRHFVANSENRLTEPESNAIKEENRLNLMKDRLRILPLENSENMKKLLTAFPLDELILLSHLYQNNFLWQIYKDELESWSIIFNRDKEFGSYLKTTIEEKQTNA